MEWSSVMMREVSIFTYLKRKYITYQPYEFWVWIGEKRDYFNRYKKLSEVKEVLENSMLKMKGKYPNLFDE